MILFNTSTAGNSTDAIRAYLKDENHYWRFEARKNAATGFYEASQHAKWTPSASAQAAPALQETESQATLDPSAPVTLNPQPLPPKALEQATQTGADVATPRQGMVNPSEKATLNPQPLPPKTTVLKPRQTTAVPSAPRP